MFLYLWALFLLLVLNEDIILRQHQFLLTVFALFNALVLAKVMIVAEDFGLFGYTIALRLVACSRD